MFLISVPNFCLNSFLKNLAIFSPEQKNIIILNSLIITNHYELFKKYY